METPQENMIYHMYRTSISLGRKYAREYSYIFKRREYYLAGTCQHYRKRVLCLVTKMHGKGIKIHSVNPAHQSLRRKRIFAECKFWGSTSQRILPCVWRRHMAKTSICPTLTERKLFKCISVYRKERKLFKCFTPISVYEKEHKLFECLLSTFEKPHNNLECLYRVSPTKHIATLHFLDECRPTGCTRKNNRGSTCHMATSALPISGRSYTLHISLRVLGKLPWTAPLQQPLPSNTRQRGPFLLIFYYTFFS
jgi:hypothetical protein